MKEKMRGAKVDIEQAKAIMYIATMDSMVQAILKEVKPIKYVKTKVVRRFRTLSLQGPQKRRLGC